MPTSPTTTPELTALVAELRSQREQEQAALQAQLIGAGHTPAQVELAMAMVYGYQEFGRVMAAPVAMSRRAFTVTLIVSLVLNLALAFISLLGLVVPITGALIGLMMIRRNRPAVGKGILFGVAASFVISMVLSRVLLYFFYRFSF